MLGAMLYIYIYSLSSASLPRNSRSRAEQANVHAPECMLGDNECISGALCLPPLPERRSLEPTGKAFSLPLRGGGG